MKIQSAGLKVPIAVILHLTGNEVNYSVSINRERRKLIVLFSYPVNDLYRFRKMNFGTVLARIIVVADIIILIVFFHVSHVNGIITVYRDLRIMDFVDVDKRACRYRFYVP